MCSCRTELAVDLLTMSSPTELESQLSTYVHSRVHCLDVFEGYVETLKRQHGLVQRAALDQPIFDPGISVRHCPSRASVYLAGADHRSEGENGSENHRPGGHAHHSRVEQDGTEKEVRVGA